MADAFDILSVPALAFHGGAHDDPTLVDGRMYLLDGVLVVARHGECTDCHFYVECNGAGERNKTFYCGHNCLKVLDHA